MKKIPRDLQGILWSKKLNSLNLEKDKSYIIHQVLAYGNLKQIKWLFNVFSRKEIIEVFTTSPRQNYTHSAFNFIKNYILDLEDNKKINPKAYVKATF